MLQNLIIMKILNKKQKELIDKIILEKYGQDNYKIWKEGRLLITDREISEITGSIIFKIPVGDSSPGRSRSIAEEYLKNINFN